MLVVFAIHLCHRTGQIPAGTLTLVQTSSDMLHVCRASCAIAGRTLFIEKACLKYIATTSVGAALQIMAAPLNQLWFLFFRPCYCINKEAHSSVGGGTVRVICCSFQQ